MRSIPLEEFIALRRLLRSSQIGIVRLRSMLDAFGSGVALIDTPAKQIAQEVKLSEAAYKGLVDGTGNGDFDADYKKDHDYITNLGGAILAYGKDGYPSQLADIYDPPILLYVLGEIREEDKKSVAIVGTRTPTPYGTRSAMDISSGLVRENFTVVSGLARGIDTTSHKAALEAGGRTIAVLGSGFRNIYPQENKKMVKEIMDGRGAVITEYSPDTKPDAINFPGRNRIISGLSLGVLVVEAAEKGGALLTAGFAIDQGKEVFAIPGNITSVKSGGTNRLIQRGEAKLVIDTLDILDELNIRPQKAPEPVDESVLVVPEDLTIFEEKIYSAIAFQPIHIDEIANLTGLNVSECLTTLLTLELKGYVRQLPGKNFKRV
ncbi:MAG: DNA processing protein DprA [Ignavibacteriaceae bacterium]|nr:MAG: DNA-protecting protein DprA [Chlorobiota bacterium]GJQ33402.1 MAG: DNA processing protein DprA [Ignavibacteriaceae bacterium]